MKILFIIPAYNEEANIIKTVNTIKSFNNRYDVIVINDGSEDHTSKLLKEHLIPHVDLVSNLGIGGAVQTGYKYAVEHNYDIAIQFDGDGQHNVEYVENLIKPIINNEADFTIGSRFIDGSKNGFQSSKLRRIGIYFIALTIRILSHYTINDPTSGFRAANKKVIHFLAENYPYEFPEPESIMMLNKTGFRTKEIPVTMYERDGGKSSIHTWISAYYMINVLFSLFIVSMRKIRDKEIN